MRSYGTSLAAAVAASSVLSAGTVDDAEYSAFLERVSLRYGSNTAGMPVFATNCADELWFQYLAAFEDGEDRQHHNCTACREFIERYGHLATINADGSLTSALWDPADAPEHYKEAVLAMKVLVERAEVTAVFLSSDKVFGTPKTGVWQHLSAINPVPHTRRDVTAQQVMAERTQDFQMARRALTQYNQAVVQRTMELLNADLLARPEKLIGPITWLNDLHTAWQNSPRRVPRDNVIWLAIGTAPAGFAHVGAGNVTATLMDDVKANLPFPDIARKHGAKMTGDRYMRPQAAPSAGTIAQAEKAFEKLDLARSLQRRFARLEEVKAIWTPNAPAKPAAGGLFGHLNPKETTTLASMALGRTNMTWAKFVSTVLLGVEKMELLVPNHGNFFALCTAVDPDAPPLLQWDHEDARNTFSTYGYVGGSRPERWNLPFGRYVPVTAIGDYPAHWMREQPNAGHQAMFYLEGARDLERHVGNALFPETLRSELHPYRSVIEAYSRSATLAGSEQATACGLRAGPGATWNIHLRVTTAAGLRDVVLDRWD